MEHLSALDEQIQKLREKLATVEGTPTEVYARIVGYYRSVKNWNKGKREEFAHRVHFAVPQIEEAECEGTNSVKQGEKDGTQAPVDLSLVSSYALFYKENCPNCPPVKDFVEKLSLSGTAVDVGNDRGLEEAEKHQVFAAPTVIFFDREGSEVLRANSLSTLVSLVQHEVPAGT